LAAPAGGTTAEATGTQCGIGKGLVAGLFWLTCERKSSSSAVDFSAKMQSLLFSCIVATAAAAAQPKLLIVFATKHNHTQTLAQAIASGAEKSGAIARVQRCNETNFTTDALEWADAIVIGAPTHYGNPASQMLAWIEAEWIHSFTDPRLAQKLGGVFTTAGGLAQGMEHTLTSLIRMLESFRIRVITPDPTTGFDSSYGAIAVTGTPPFNISGPPTWSQIHPDFIEPAAALGSKIAAAAAALKSCAAGQQQQRQ
jgi:NAD(P)H dehydrogenase (quinone)